MNKEEYIELNTQTIIEASGLTILKDFEINKQIKYRVVARMWIYNSKTTNTKCHQAKLHICKDGNLCSPTIWEGTFFSDDYQGINDADKELEDIAKKYNIKLLQDTDWGERYITEEEYNQLAKEIK